MINDQIHSQIVHNLKRVEEWFEQQSQDLFVPIYSSYDIRDSGFKVTNVDANIFPAGFNNICLTDREHAGAIAEDYIDRHYGKSVKRLLVLTEEHTNNPYYWDNVNALRKIFVDAGREVRMAIPRSHSTEPMAMKSATAGDISVCTAVIHDGAISVKDFQPDLIVSNNDFSEFYAEWGPELTSMMNPPRELGWYQRKKSTYFDFYNKVATEFAKLLELDPWLFTVETHLISHFDTSDETSREDLAIRTETMLNELQARYNAKGIDSNPFLFMKNNSGTYGLAVMKIESADEIRALNYKSRKKMKAAKGGRVVEEVILQEGVPSITRAEGITAEPAIYLLGSQLAGGFLRTHAEKDPTESLNSPGAVYKRLCVSDLKVNVEGSPLENIYGWVAKLGLLAIGLETRSMNVRYKGYEHVNR